uniref:Non-structural protein n=1 Tax=Rice ragged stunt virus TaxID=42475 RepID=F4YTV2_RRSV|nr:non-structural protein [Rice ragged stunt virus]
MDELTLSIGGSPGKLAGTQLLYKQKIDKEIRLSPTDLLFSSNTVDHKLRNKRTTIALLSREVQARLGKWMISFADQKGTAADFGLQLAKWVQASTQLHYYVHPADMSALRAADQSLIRQLPRVTVEVCKTKKVSQTDPIEHKYQSRPGMIEGGVTITPRQAVTLEEIYPLASRSEKGVIMFMLSQAHLEHLIHPVIKQVSNYFTCVKVGTSGFSLNYNHPYIRAMFLEPITACDVVELPLQALHARFSAGKGHLYLCGDGHAPRTLTCAQMFDIPHVHDFTMPSVTVVSFYAPEQHIAIARYASWYEKDTICRLLQSTLPDVKSWYGCVLCHIQSSLPSGQTLTGKHFSRCKVVVSVSAERSRLLSDGLPKWAEWVDNVLSDRIAKPACLILIGPKASSKSFVTRQLVAKLNASSLSVEGDNFGRVDSDAFGKWVTMMVSNSTLPTSWAQFDLMQNDKEIASYVDIRFNDICVKHGFCELDDLRTKNAGVLQGEFARSFIEIIKDPSCGLRAFFSWLFSLYGLPRGLMLESHTNVEIAEYPPTTCILQLLPNYDVMSVLLERDARKGISKLAEMQMEEYYNGLRIGTYRSVLACELLRVAEVGPPVEG